MKQQLWYFLVSSIVVVFSCGQNQTTLKDTVTDVDGNVYPTVKIGNQIWMAENLKVTHFRNGDPIPNHTDDAEWDTPNSAWCAYDNETSNVEIYGRLYNWFAVNDSRGLAPEGWHVPTDPTTTPDNSAPRYGSVRLRSPRRIAGHRPDRRRAFVVSS